jgi:hypothetical protein
MQLRNPTPTNKNPNIVVASWGDKNKFTLYLPTLPQNKYKNWGMPKGNPIFCSFDKPIAKHINKVSFCFWLISRNLDMYNFDFFRGKEVWLFHLTKKANFLEERFAFALLRHGVTLVCVDSFPIGENSHA